MPGGDNSPNWANSGGRGMAEMQNFLKLLDLGTHFLRLLTSSVFIEIYKMVGRLCPALRQNCNPPGSGFCSCLVGLDINENGSFRRQFRFINPDHF